MSEQDEEEEQELIKYTRNYGEITKDSKFWNDLEQFGEDKLLKLKIIKIKIYTGNYMSHKAIFGIGFTFKSLVTGETLPYKEYKGSQQFDDVVEFDIKKNEYLNGFHVAFAYEGQYISQVGFDTNKGNKILVGTGGEDKTIEANGGDNIIIGTTGCVNIKLDAIGVLYINKREFFKKKFFPLFMLNNLTKNDEKFKKETEAHYNKLSNEYKYAWKTVNLPDALFSQVIKFCAV